MAEIRPFRGLRYNSRKISLEEVITEPYDRIPPDLQEEYHRRNPYNVVRIILGKDDDPEHPEKDKYKRARIYLDEWRRKRILLREKKEAIYIYEQEFCSRDGIKKRRGMIERVKLEEFSSRKVLPHEKTFPKYKEDRLKLLRATEANTEQVFLLYRDEEKRVAKAVEKALKKAVVAADALDEDQNRHRILTVTDNGDIRKIKEAMADKILIIADGHHRYETSLNYRREMVEKMKVIAGDESFHYIMMTLFDLNDPGLVILPTYRLVKGLDKLTEEGLKKYFSSWFEVSETACPDPSDSSVLEKAQQQVETRDHSFAAYVGPFKKIILFRLKSEDILDEAIPERSKEWRRLDVAILHSMIIDKLAGFTSGPYVEENSVNYIRNLDEGLKKVVDGEYQMIFLLRPVSLQQIKVIVENGELMPHKSTDFYPKLKSGLVMNPL